MAGRVEASGIERRANLKTFSHIMHSHYTCFQLGFVAIERGLFSKLWRPYKMPLITINVQVGDVFHTDRRRTITNINSNNVVSTNATLSRGELIANINAQVERKN